MRVKLFVCTIVLCCLGSASAQDINCRHRDGKAANCNGISVGAPKVFDNRALTLMLETLNQNLKQQNNFIDQKTLINALANFQGLSTSEFNTNLSVTGPSTPTRDV